MCVCVWYCGTHLPLCAKCFNNSFYIETVYNVFIKCVLVVSINKLYIIRKYHIIVDTFRYIRPRIIAVAPVQMRHIYLKNLDKLILSLFLIFIFQCKLGKTFYILSIFNVFTYFFSLKLKWYDLCRVNLWSGWL